MSPKNNARKLGATKPPISKPLNSRSRTGQFISKTAALAEKQTARTSSLDPPSRQSSQSATATYFSKTQADGRNRVSPDDSSEHSIPAKPPQKLEERPSIASSRPTFSSPGKTVPKTLSVSRSAATCKIVVAGQKAESPRGSPSASDSSVELIYSENQEWPDWAILENNQRGPSELDREDRQRSKQTSAATPGPGTQLPGWWNEPIYDDQGASRGSPARPAAAMKACIAQIEEIKRDG